MAHVNWLVVCCLTVCVSQSAFGDQPRSFPPATSPQVQQSVERAIGYLQTQSAAWLKQRRCAACHDVAMPLWSLSEAGRQGYAIDKTFVVKTGQALDSTKSMIASGIAANPAAPPDPRPMARGVNMGAVFMAVAAPSLPSLDDGQKQSLRSIAADAVKKQRDDGSWEFFLSRPPINESQASDAAWIIMALQGETRLDDTELHRQALDKGIVWLAGAELSGSEQLKALKLLVAIRAGKPREQLRSALDELVALQRADGGWGQMASMPSDAFATGQTLYVLSLAGYGVQSPPINRGIGFLVATQKSDGSWPMTSRATPDGRPGSAKLLTPITCAATSWATLGLSRLAPIK